MADIDKAIGSDDLKVEALVEAEKVIQEANQHQEAQLGLEEEAEQELDKVGVAVQLEGLHLKQVRVIQGEVEDNVI